MARTITLDQIRIASPCPMTWNDMQGDDRMRYCSNCSLNVYNFAAMTQGEAEKLINETEGRLCGIIYRRADGTIMTRDCPIGLRALKRKARWMLGKFAAAVLLVAGAASHALVTFSRSREQRTSLSMVEPIGRLRHWLNPPAPPLPPPAGGIAILGDVCLQTLPGEIATAEPDIESD